MTPVQNRPLTFQTHIRASHLSGLPWSLPVELRWQSMCSLPTLAWNAFPTSCVWQTPTTIPLPRIPPLWSSHLSFSHLGFPLTPFTVSSLYCLHLKGRDQTDSALLMTQPTLRAPSIVFNCCQMVVFPYQGHQIPESCSLRSPAQALPWLSDSVSFAIFQYVPNQHLTAAWGELPHSTLFPNSLSFSVNPFLCTKMQSSIMF